MNKAILIGRLANDPELRYTQNGKAVANFNLAVNRPFSKTNEADFFRIITWQKIAENCANYLNKGRMIALEGRIQTRSYEVQGERKYITEIIAQNVQFLGTDSKHNNYQKKQQKNNHENDLKSIKDEINLDDFAAIDEEDIPF